MSKILNNAEGEGKMEKLVPEHRPSHEELIEACKPLLDILYDHYSPHAYIVVSQAHVEILEGDMVASFDLRD